MQQNYDGGVTTWTVTTADSTPEALDVDTVIFGLSGSSEPQIVSATALASDTASALLAWAKDLGATSDPDTAKKLPAPTSLAAKTVVLVGLSDSPLEPSALRYAAGVAARVAGDQARIGLSLPNNTQDDVTALIEGALLGLHSPTKVGATPESEGKSLVVVSSLPSPGIEEGETAARSVTWVRDLVHEPPNLLYPETFVERVRQFASDTGIEVEVFDDDALREGGFGGILGVGGGSIRTPRLIALRYRPGSPAGHIALVGKGITFDSGGLSLKPAGSMVGMKYDMTGAATVAGAVIAAARLGSPVDITGWLCVAENMPSGSALRPNDVITIRGGKTVEVLNTDAEGRLVMADGLARASEDEPDLIIDVATLTGAARVALGERYSALMGSDAAVEAVTRAATDAGEQVWRLPLARELRSALDSDVADIANAKPGNTLGGTLLAGLFLEEFVGPAGADPESTTRIPWAHLDIAGPASNSSAPYGYTPKGATGVLVRSLIGLLRSGDVHVRELSGQ